MPDIAALYEDHPDETGEPNVYVGKQGSHVPGLKPIEVDNTPPAIPQKPGPVKHMLHPLVAAVFDPNVVTKSLTSKRDWSLVDLSVLGGAVDVMQWANTRPVNPYTRDSWKLVEDPIATYRSAILRHLTAMDRGEVLDPDSGLPHADHIQASSYMLAWHVENAKVK